MDQTPVDTLTQEEADDEKYAASRAYQAIKELKLVDKDIAKMLSLASSSILLLALPQTDNEADGSASLPKGDERSEQFVLEANEYFQLIDTIQEKIREAIARVRQYRINPSVLDASQPNAIPSTFGVGLPHYDVMQDASLEKQPGPERDAETGGGPETGVESQNGPQESNRNESEKKRDREKERERRAALRDRGLQETRMERDSWKRIYELLQGEKERREGNTKGKEKVVDGVKNQDNGGDFRDDVLMGVGDAHEAARGDENKMEQ